MRTALSNNHSSYDDQVADVVSWLSNDDKHKDMMQEEFLAEFPEYNTLEWSGAWVNGDASGVDDDYMCWVSDWIDSHTLVYWEQGEPWIGENCPDGHNYNGLPGHCVDCGAVAEEPA